jgi:cytochrome c oxidase subunit 2
MHPLKINLAGLALILVAGLGVAGQETAPATGSGSQAVEIKVTARKYRFNPNPITVKKGEHVKLLITALDHDHGFKLEAFNINQKIKKGTTATIEFTADKAGTFPFQCSDFCGIGHPRMKGKLVVEEQ